MTTSTQQRLLIAFSSVLVGCAVGATMPRLAAQSFPPSPTAQRWEQFCDRPTEREVNRELSLRGAEGFELVSMTFNASPGADPYLCFKRPAPR